MIGKSTGINQRTERARHRLQACLRRRRGKCARERGGCGCPPPGLRQRLPWV